MGMSPTCRRAAIAAAVAAALVAAAAAHAQPLPLQEENFLALPVGQEFDAACNPDGNSTFTFSVTGVATGPYPGTFTETGTIVIGPQQSVLLQEYAVPGGPVILAHTDFTIDSPLGTVEGSKDLTVAVPQPGVITNAGTCSTVGTSAGLERSCDEVFGEPAAGDFASFHEFFATMRYQATITTAEGRFRDSGVATVRVENDIVFACILAGQPVQNVAEPIFVETFVRSDGVVPFTTPGQATGGGQISGGVTFGLTAFSDERGIHATCAVVDGPTRVQCTDGTSYAQADGHATFSGTARVNGVDTTYQIDVQDNGDPGAGSDTFSIVTGSGYAAAGVLTAGDVQVHD